MHVSRETRENSFFGGRGRVGSKNIGFFQFSFNDLNIGITCSSAALPSVVVAELHESQFCAYAKYLGGYVAS